MDGNQPNPEYNRDQRELIAWERWPDAEGVDARLAIAQFLIGREVHGHEMPNLPQGFITLMYRGGEYHDLLVMTRTIEVQDWLRSGEES